MTIFRRPLRLFLTTDTVGGVWNFSLELARELAKKNFTVLLASMGPQPHSHQLQEASDLKNCRWVHRTCDLEWMENGMEQLDETGAWLLDLAQDFQPDLAHLNEFAHAALPWPTPVVLTVHSCILTWWRAVKKERAPASYDRYSELVQRALQSAQRVVFPTESLRCAMELEYGKIPSAQIIPNGRQPRSKNSAIKKPLIFSAGRFWDEAKNIALLTAIQSELDWPIYLAGSVPLSVEKIKPKDKLRLCGILSAAEMNRWFSQASLYAAPAWYEPFGLSILEAAQNGCALVLADIPSLRELWSDAAIFISPTDPQLWQQTLNHLARHSEIRETLGQRAQTRALTYSRLRFAKDYVTLYKQTLEKRSCAASADLDLELAPI